MMWEYKNSLIKHPEMLNRKLRRQKKNLFRRKRISVYRLKTQGFGFLNSAVLKQFIAYFYLQRQSLFFTYRVGLLKPEVCFKNTTKLPATTIFLTALYLKSFFFFNLGTFKFNFSDDKYVITLSYFNKLLGSIFFFKLFFFKLFFFKLFFFKIKKYSFIYNKFTLNLFKRV